VLVLESGKGNGAEKGPRQVGRGIGRESMEEELQQGRPLRLSTRAWKGAGKRE
jgi:hypothetical protein